MNGQLGAGPSDGHVQSGARSSGEKAQLGEKISNHYIHSGAAPSIDSGQFGAKSPNGHGQAGAGSSGGYDQLEAGVSFGYGHSGARSRNDYGKSEASSSSGHGQSGHGILGPSGPTGEAQSGNLGHMGNSRDVGASQHRSPVNDSALPPPVQQGGGVEMGSGSPLGQTNALNKDLLAQEGLLGAIILNNQNLIKEREMLLKILLGSRTSPAGKDHLLEAAGSLALEGLLWKGSLRGLCGHGSLVGINDVLKNTIPFGKLSSWFKIIDFDIVQVSWKVHPLSNLQLDFQTRLTINFPGLLSFLSGSTLDVTIKASLALPQTRSGQVSLTLLNCQPVFTRIHNLLSAVREVMLERILQNSLPNVLCPVIQFWFYIINQQLSILKSKLCYWPEHCSLAKTTAVST
uniref:Uncharacterized protein n=1 Tax=Equus caballus TaxID=9796 RepID=A0A9L0RI44_HORSE